jgi:hypothetical protein
MRNSFSVQLCGAGESSSGKIRKWSSMPVAIRLAHAGARLHAIYVGSADGGFRLNIRLTVRLLRGSGIRLPLRMGSPAGGTWNNRLRTRKRWKREGVPRFTYEWGCGYGGARSNDFVRSALAVARSRTSGCAGKGTEPVLAQRAKQASRAVGCRSHRTLAEQAHWTLVVRTQRFGVTHSTGRAAIGGDRLLRSSSRIAY